MKLNRLLGALCAGLMLISLPARAVEQSSYVTPVAGPMTMATFAGTYLNPALRAIASCHWGASAPANGPSSTPIAYQCWADTTTNPVVFKRYDGASWATWGKLNTSTHLWTPSYQGTDLGTASIATTGISGHTIPFLDGTVTVSGAWNLGTPSAVVLTNGTSLPAAALTGQVSVPNGGTGLAVGQSGGVPCYNSTTSLLSSTALALNGVMVGGGVGACPGAITAGTNGQLLLGVTSSAPAMATMSGDATISNAGALTLATVNSNTGAIGSATQCVTVTNNAKGLTTAVSAATCTPAIGSITGLGTSIAAALATNVGSAGAPVLFNGAGGTPSSMTGTNITGTASGLTAGNVTTNANLTGDVTSVGNATTVTNSSVIAKVLTAFASGAGTVSSSDSILTAFQKIVGNIALKADIASPTFTGTPAAPTAAGGTNTTQVATTQFVQSAVVASTTGVASIAGNTGAFTVSKGITNSTNDIQLALNNVTTQVQPSDAAAVGADRMMGYGVVGATGGCRITPVYSGRVLVKIIGSSQSSVNAAVNTIQARYGTGSAPVYAASTTGTNIGPAMTTAQSGTVLNSPFDAGGVVTGLTPTTTYWFDLFVSRSSGNATILNVGCTLIEF